jgi:hypothetical protein
VERVKLFDIHFLSVALWVSHIFGVELGILLKIIGMVKVRQILARRTFMSHLGLESAA